MLLREVGNAGFPESHFHAPSLEKWLGYYGFQNDEFGTRQDALKGVFKSAFERGKGAGDIFGLRLQRHSFDFFIEQLSVLYPSFPDDKSRMGAAFGDTLFVHLTRENKLDQAISYVKAEQTGLWHMASDGTELERLSEQKEPVYDAVAIATQLALSEQMDTEWVKWFVAEKSSLCALRMKNCLLRRMRPLDMFSKHSAWIVRQETKSRHLLQSWQMRPIRNGLNASG